MNPIGKIQWVSVVAKNNSGKEFERKSSHGGTACKFMEQAEIKP